MLNFLCYSIKEKAKSLVRDRNTGPDTDTVKDSQDGHEAGSDSDSYNQQTGITEDIWRGEYRNTWACSWLTHTSEMSFGFLV